MTPRQRAILDEVARSNLRGSRPRIPAGRDRDALKRLGYIRSGPRNLPGMCSVAGRGLAWSVTDAGLKALDASQSSD